MRSSLLKTSCAAATVAVLLSAAPAASASPSPSASNTPPGKIANASAGCTWKGGSADGLRGRLSIVFTYDTATPHLLATTLRPAVRPSKAPGFGNVSYTVQVAQRVTVMRGTVSCIDTAYEERDVRLRSIREPIVFRMQYTDDNGQRSVCSGRLINRE